MLAWQTCSPTSQQDMQQAIHSGRVQGYFSAHGWQPRIAYTWHRASRGNSATAELLIVPRDALYKCGMLYSFCSCQSVRPSVCLSLCHTRGLLTSLNVRNPGISCYVTASTLLFTQSAENVTSGTRLWSDFARVSSTTQTKIASFGRR